MEGGGDMDEFERLLGEIPTVTSGNTLSGQASRISFFQELDVIPKDLEKGSSSSSEVANLCNSSQPATCQGLLYGGASVPTSPNDQKLQRKGISHEIPVVITGKDKSNSSDEKSLTHLFEDMSIRNNPTTKACSAPVKNCQSSSSDCSFLLNEQLEDNLKEDPFAYDATDMYFSSSSRNLNRVTLPCINIEAQSPQLNLVTPGAYEPNRIIESLLGNLSRHQKIVPINTLAIPINPGMNSCQLLPSVQGVELPNLVQPGYYMRAQSHPKHTTQPVVGQHSVEEKYSQFQQQFSYAKLLQNPEILQKRKKNCMGRVVENGMQPCSEFPSPHQFEYCNQNPYFNDDPFQHEFNRLHYIQYKTEDSSGRGENGCSLNGQKLLSAYGQSCLTRHIPGHQMLDKVGNRHFPDKILTRSHGANSVRNLTPNPLKTDEPLLFDENVRRCNAHSHQPHGSLKLDRQICHVSSSNDFESGLFSNSMQIKYTSVDEIVGRICLMAKDQEGCRFLQAKFTEGCREDIDKIFSEIICHIVELMIDPFGNYLLQKLLEVCNEEQMMLIVQGITGHTGELIRISCDKHGTRVVQKVIEALCTPEQISMVVSSLEPGIVSVMKNTNGNHVAQRLLQCLTEHCEFLIDAAITHCVELATDPQGCCVLQKCVMHSEGDRNRRLMTQISSNSLLLSQDPFGNYLIQFVLKLDNAWASAAVVKKLKGSFDSLSLQKYSSNVVEKCLQLEGDDYCVDIIQELLASPVFPQILHNPYGNYVIQTALRKSTVRREVHATLVEAIKPHASVLRCSPYGKKVLFCASLSSKK